MQNHDLAHFRYGLSSLFTNNSMRPFLCSGSPLACRVFIVGFNPATNVGTDFWHYWSDTNGFDKISFMQDYKKVKKLRGARPRIEGFVEQFPSNCCLETNICSTPTKRASDLASEDRRTAIFQYLFSCIRPELVFLHSNEPIRFFERATGCKGFDKVPKRAEWQGHTFTLFALPGPLWRAKVDDVRGVGRRLARGFWDLASRGSCRATPGTQDQFAQRFLPRSSYP
jgi:hypothetical protein